MNMEIHKQRMTAETEGDYVVFLIGMRINKWWKVHKWLPVALAMPKMLRELYQNSELGFVHAEQWFGRTTIMVQYWKSYEDLEAYAKGKTFKHLPAWKAFNQKIGQNGDVGIWHETYLIDSNKSESIYAGMPRFGLAKYGEHVAVSEAKNSASQRLKG